MRRAISRAYRAYGWFRQSALACLLASLSSCETPVSSPTAPEQTAPTASVERIVPSPEALKWLAIAEDETKDIQDRIKAVEHLERLKEEATADRLVKLLPGNYGAFAFRIVVTLGAIKSPRALPALEKMYNEKEIDVPGKIRVVLKGAIRVCRGDTDAPE